MNIVCLRKTLIGDVIYVKSDPVVGVIALTAFTESLSGVTGTEFFLSKVFRYTLDGINWSDWLDLTTPNITSLTFDSKDSLIFELAYKKNTPEPSLDIVGVDFTGTDSPTGYVEEYFRNSIFANYFNSSDLEVLRWYINVLQKVYKRGILPNYIDRLDDFESDEDFIIFWKSIAKFFSYFVIYARKYQKFYEVESLLEEYIEQRGLKTSIHNDLADLQYLMKNYYHQIFNRGTIHIVDDTSIDNTIEVDGELLRLIYYKYTDEFLFNLHKTEHFGWNLGNSSPLWRGLQQNQNLHKIQLYTNPAANNRIKVNSSLSYALNFFIQLPADKVLRVKANGFDKDGNIVVLTDYTTGLDSVNLCILEDVPLQRDDKAIFFQGIFYQYDKTPYVDGTTNLNQGTHFIFKEEVVEILIYVETVDFADLSLPYSSRPASDITNTQTLSFATSNFCFYPLYTNYSHGIVQVYNWISCWLKNNNQQYSLHEVKQFIRKYLIPYNSHLEIWKSFDTGVEVTTTDVGDVLAWRGVNPVCQYEEEVIEVYYEGGDPICEQE